MLASWVSTAAPFHSSFCICQYEPLNVCLTHGKSSCHCKTIALLFSEFLNMAGVLCLCFVMLLVMFIVSLCSHTCWVDVICFPLFHLGARPFVLYLCTLGLGAEIKLSESTALQIANGNKVGFFPHCYVSQPFTKELSLTTSILYTQRWKHEEGKQLHKGHR